MEATGRAARTAAPRAVRQFAATMSPAHAKLLSTDPRISEVVETPRRRPSSAPVPTPRPGHRFTPQPTGYGSDGQSGTYSYDSSGNITAVGADTYLYDAENRLTTSVTRGATETYTYDAFGNRKSATGATNCLGQTVCAQPVTVSNSTNRLLTINGATVHYETPGNIIGIDAITGSPATSYVYDGTEMMNESTVGSDDRQYVYTADDERIAVKRGVSWTWSVRDPNKKVLREFTSVETGSNFGMTSRAWIKDYVWRDGLLLAATTSSGTLHYHLDHLGTPRLITDPNAVKVAEHAYYPFGAEINILPHEGTQEAMKFNEHERDIVAGDGHTLDYMHARYYAASLGRFLSVDPLEADPNDPQSWNRYAYVRNNPIDRTDPDGREDKKWNVQQIINEAGEYVEGIENGYGSSVAFEIGHHPPTSGANALGQAVGSTTALVQSVDEAGTGAALAAAGGTVTVLSGGVASPVRCLL
jgi:RHS repeat-associated protein